MDRASAPNNPRMASTATVMIVVVNGKRQNSHNMLPADTVITANSAMMFTGVDFTRVDDESVMPVPPRINANDSLQYYTYRLIKRLYRKALILNFLLNEHIACFYPSMVSRRQWRAVNTNSNSATASDAAADIRTSSPAMGSSLSTRVINRCWLREGMNINALVGLSE